MAGDRQRHARRVDVGPQGRPAQAEHTRRARGHRRRCDEGGLWRQPAHPAWRLLPGFADCVRQHRQPVAGSRSFAARADVGASRPGRFTKAARSSGAHRERGAGRARRYCRHGRRLPGREGHHRPGIQRCEVCADRRNSVATDTGLRLRTVAADGSGLRYRSSLADVACQSGRRPTRRQPQHSRQFIAVAENPRHRAGDAVSRADRRSRLADAELAEPPAPGTWLPDRPSRGDQPDRPLFFLLEAEARCHVPRVAGAASAHPRREARSPGAVHAAAGQLGRDPDPRRSGHAQRKRSHRFVLGPHHAGVPAHSRSADDSRAQLHRPGHGHIASRCHRRRDVRQEVL